MKCTRARHKDNHSTILSLRANAGLLLNRKPPSQLVQVMPRGSRSTQPATNGASPVPSSSATVTSSPRKPKFVSRLWQRVVHSPKSDENQSSRPLPAPPRYPSFASSFEWVPDSPWFLPGRSTEWLDYEPSPIPHTGYDNHNEITYSPL